MSRTSIAASTEPTGPPEADGRQADQGEPTTESGTAGLRGVEPLLASLLPPYVAAAESFGPRDGDWRAGLFPAEAQAVERAGEKRRHEFAGARVCARQALQALALRPVPLLPGPRGEPRWPPGAVGSMTHCAGYRAAAVARRDDGVAGLGIDAEPHAPLADGVLEMVAGPREQEHLAALARARPEVCWERVLFSVKEAVFKAWYPLARSELDFLEAEVGFSVGADGSAGGFRAVVAKPGPLPKVTGRWRVARGVIASAVVVRAGERTAR
ncbi:4'-phosphopantetheinyl transferase family protein [Streptacidiphilus melanogenes]|uniref:4'-phosphopantetheinyl transferase family protein n=1 Tax=Streptacidiphilus melanogenes TaxID=411235 RepID=UPI000A05DC6D|nr:4'-phosphopantetheinyl transferase superfamily protein [Streptacidiphilus melanogenes]